MKKSLTKFGISFLKTIYCFHFILSNFIKICLPIYGIASTVIAGFMTYNRNYPDAIIILCSIVLMYVAYYVFVAGTDKNIYKASIDLQYSYKAAPVTVSRQTRKQLRRIEKIIG